MAARKPFLLRIDPEVFAAVQRWAGDELRSVNGQIEFILRRALQREGRLANPGAEVAGGEKPAPGPKRPETDVGDATEPVDS